MYACMHCAWIWYRSLSHGANGDAWLPVPVAQQVTMIMMRLSPKKLCELLCMVQNMCLSIIKPPIPSQNELLQGGPRLQLAAMFSTSVNKFAPPLISSMVQQVFHYIVKPLITDPLKSGQPLYSGQLTHPRLILTNTF